MTTFLAPFELRRLLVKLSRGVSGGTSEDADWITFHFAKITSGAVDSNWLAADYAAVEARFDTCWTTIKPKYPVMMSLNEYRWYKDGPVWSPDDLANGPTNPAQRITSRSVAGTGAGTAMPPQVATTITERVGIEKRRGRFYLPAFAVGWTTVDGRIDPTAQSALLAAFVTFYNGCRADGKMPVVFSRGRSARTTSAGTFVPDHAASAYEVLELRMDNIFDVLRSRRFGGPTIRTTTVLT